MTTFRAILRGGAPPPTAPKAPSSSSSHSKPAELQEAAQIDSSKPTAPTSPALRQEYSDIEDAMAAAELIMNDNVEGAEARFRSRNATSSFHQLGLGVTTFMTSILGFEKDAMTEAGVRLTETENRSAEDLRKAQKEAQKSSAGGWFGRGTAVAGDVGASSIYPPGSEFALVNAESQLMNAVVAVMHESLTEGIKGFYKLRKAFLTLDGIMEAENKYLNRVRNGGVSRPTTAAPPRLSEDMMPGSFDQTEFAEYEDTKESDSDGEFADARSVLQRSQTPLSQSTSHSRSSSLDNLSANTTPASNPAGVSSSSPPFHSQTTTSASDLFTSPVDIFIHSGANMCFGILLLIVSLVPPAFSRLLSVLGFRGDRDRGVAMLWESTRVRNVNGAIAGLVLLGYYNALLGFADILPAVQDVDELAEEGEIVGYPAARCDKLLEDMTARYPESRLWKLQEAREMANGRRLQEAVEMLGKNEGGKMKQIAALNAFELGLNTMFVMDWSQMRVAFERCLELNKWSHSVYYYMIGCAELEMYRDAWHRAAKLAQESSEREVVEVEMRRHKKAAEENFRKAPTVAGRKKFLAKQMPFELFVIRKLQKWEERAARLGLELADAPVVSPALEMVYLYSGSKRMTDELLERARGYMKLDRCTMTREQREKALAEERDEGAIWAVGEAALLRSLGRTREAREVLGTVLDMDRNIFKGPTRDDYTLPSAHYEMAAAAWRDGCDATKWPLPEGPEAIDAYRKEKAEETLAYLEKNAKWESYVLDGRFGMRIQAGIDSVKWLRGKKGW
ncbi:hypothetical protein GE09DRAFT_532767 [Coniochaeta sp. 2T2.1]|nr:hypothetical protein GE09DRAFT_532767 [Coniochaeta sp. 2T2.1]